MTIRCSLCLSLLLLLVATPLRAAPVDSAAGLVAAPEAVIDFDTTLPEDVGVTLAGSLVSAPTYGIFTGNHLSAGGSSEGETSLTNALEIRFDGTVTAAAFLLVTNPGDSTFIASLSGLEVERYTAFTDYSVGNDWAGFEGITFDTLRIEPGGTNGVIHLDELGFSGFVPAAPAPEPAALGVLGFALAALGSRSRRRG